MSTVDEEANTLEAVREFTLGICSNRPLRPVSVVRAEARRVMRHYPLAVGERWKDNR